ncbi:MAG: hypothetical protein K2Q21_03905 [Chitinophagaceae bacterium]|nr:hypothetical protein [Chitinophagaceae bacterium]
MKRVFLFFCLLTGVFAASAQQNNGSSYTTALGLKMYPGALSVKHFFAPGKAVEGLAFISQDGFRITGLYEIHNSLGSVEGLKWYIGGGGHMGIWSDRWKTQYPDRNANASIGVDGVLGLDYKIKGAPINVSFDWQPSFNFIGYNYFESAWGGLGIRYTF